ncbi:oligosaccharide flippase family protein [Vibrio sp. S11_S32]|uniref:oligosaccharide flippase family protein n=1 Tax=Vibrio sp. S11_S32 TaxID=2720225 RepID=UPI00168172AC|nr:oligosaccharide flippase family protein [Vibrio sp. S11_S32]MBD1577921.1 oligosaccharide flippase family protein [Vibrio sp. S11_S32]
MKKQIAKNITVNIFSFTVNFLAAIILTPYLVSNLGVSAYGLIPIAMFFTEYVGIITQSLSASINRNLTLALQSNDDSKALEIFNTSLVVVIFIVFFQCLVSIYPIENLNNIIKIEHGFYLDAKLLFLFTLISFSISLINSIFSVSMYSSNRLDIIQFASIFRLISKSICIFLFFSFDNISLASVGISSIIGSSVGFIITLLYWKKLTPELRIDLRKFRKKECIPIFSIGGWLLVNQIGFLLFSKVDILIVNKFLGSNSGGAYSIATKFSDLIRSISTVLSGVLGPVIMLYFAKNKIDEMVSISVRFIKYLSLSMSIPIIFVCIYSKSILSLWIGSEFEYLSPLVWLITLPLIINIGVTPLFSINIAMNKIKLPAIITLVLGFIGLVVSIILISETELGYYSIAISSGVILTLKNALFTPIYASVILNQSKFKYLYLHLSTLLFSLILILIFYVVNNRYRPDTYFELFLSFVVYLSFSLSLFFIMLSKDDKKILKNIVAKKFNT